MTASQIVFFLCWLAVALAGGVLLYIVWERLHAKTNASD